MSTPNDSIDSRAPRGAAVSSLDSGERRRLLRGGLAAGPVLMTIASRPVLANTACLAASAMGSMPTSGRTHVASVCSGLTPEQWAAIATQWPSPYVGQGDNINVDAVAQAAPAPAPSAPTQTFITRTRTATNGVTIGSRAAPSFTTTVAAPVQTTTTAPTQSIATSSTSVSTPTTSTSVTTTTTSSTRGVTIGSRAPPSMFSTQLPSTQPAPATASAPTTTQPTTTALPGTPFHGPTTGFGGNAYGSMSMLDVIGGDSNPAGLGRYVVAALLNARAGRTPVLDEFGVRSMWNDVVSRGYYEPTAGVQWGPAQIVAYLRTTMG